jgi:hypothetical protein
MITLAQGIAYASEFSTGISIVYSILPKVETFQKYPKFQAGYGLFLEILKSVGLNIRNLVHPDIATQGGSQISVAAASGQNPTVPPQP